ncbi:MAG: hypothetical protein CVT66_05825 [Actinobacteria bacterium HGW-Actinobacteria-6]|nr:MAG: hypothetical protein CVT66_05825 [Actinobacteria bacterium HGW-Actinobacteria-6]
MGLTIVTGGANAGKTGELHEAIREAVLRGEAPLLLLPSAPEVDRAEDEFSYSGSSLSVSILQFDRYLDSLWGLHGDGRALVRPTQRLLIINKVLSVADLSVLARSAARPGFARLFESVVQRAGESLSLDGYRAAVAHGRAARELLGLVDAYADALRESDLVEPPEAHRLLSMTLAADALPSLIAINRFASFTPAQAAFIRRCAALDVDTRVALTWVDGHPATTAAASVVGELLDIDGARLVVVDDAPHENAELRSVGQRLFFSGEEIGPDGSSGSVTLSGAAGTSGEAARITREVQELAISGSSYGDIAVVFRNPEGHVTRLVNAFREAGVPADIDAQIQAAGTGLGRALVLLLGYLCGGQHRADLMGFLRSGYSWADSAEVDSVDEALRRSRVLVGRAVFTRALTVGPRTRLLLERASELAGAPVDPSAVDGWRWLVADMLRSAHGPAVILDDRGMVDAAAQRTVMAAIQEIATLGGGDAGAIEVLRILGDARVTLKPDATRSDRVQVMSAERARSRRFAVVILGGLNAGEFPALPSEDALSSPELAADLLSAGIDMSSRIDADAERLLFYQVITGARERLVLSRMVCDDDGRPVRASSLWEEFLDLYRDPVSGMPYGGRELPVRRLELGDLTETEDAPLAERRRLRALALVGESTEPRVSAARWRTRPRAGCLSTELTAELAARDTFSASEIEGYLACPFGWFYQRVLGAAPLDEEMGALEKGRLAHDIMKRVYDDRTESALGRITPENTPEALSRYARIAAEALAASSAASTLLEDEMLLSAVASSERIMKRDATFLPGFEPIAHEFSFGMGEDDAPVQIGSFFLRGRIDRIDASKSGVVIIDYKTGAAVSKKSDFEKKRLVQLPLYGLVAAERLGRRLLGGLYRSMQYGGDRGFYRADQAGLEGLAGNDMCDDAEFDEVLKSAIERAEQAVAGIRAGRIPAEPVSKSACAYCSAATVCGGRQS